MLRDEPAARVFAQDLVGLDVGWVADVREPAFLGFAHVLRQVLAVLAQVLAQSAHLCGGQWLSAGRAAQRRWRCGGEAVGVSAALR